MKLFDTLRAFIHGGRLCDGQHEAALEAVAAEKVEPPVAAMWALLAAHRRYAMEGIRSCADTLPPDVKLRLVLVGALIDLWEKSRGEAISGTKAIAMLCGFDEKLMSDLANEWVLKLQATGTDAATTAADILAKFSPNAARPN